MVHVASIGLGGRSVLALLSPRIIAAIVNANRSHSVTPCFPLLCSEKQASFPSYGTTSGQHFFKFCRLFRWLWCFPFACCESGPHHGARRPSSNASPLLFHYRPIIIALATDPPVFSTTPWWGTVERWQFASPFAKNLGSACADAPRYLEHSGRTAAIPILALSCLDSAR